MTPQKLPSSYVLSAEVSKALNLNQPIVALETAVLTHGLPYPQNIQLSQDLESAVRGQGAIPATVGVFEGKVHVGLTAQELENLGDTTTLADPAVVDDLIKNRPKE